MTGVKGGRTLRVECKKGPLTRSRSSVEYRLLREALGQLLTIREVRPSDSLAVAVPDSPKFRDLIRLWTDVPLVRRIGIRFLTVSPGGAVSGIDGLLPEQVREPTERGDRERLGSRD